MEALTSDIIVAQDRAMWATEQAMQLLSKKDRENLTVMEQKLHDFADVIHRVAFLSPLP